MVGDIRTAYEQLISEGVEFLSAPNTDRYGEMWVYMRDPTASPWNSCSPAPARRERSRTDAERIDMTKVLYLYGGWPGHHPYEVTMWAAGLMSDLGFELDETQDRACSSAI